MELKEFYKEAFDRNRGVVSEKQQEKLRNTTIAIPGMGGVGDIHATTLARLGIGNFHIADFDTFSIANFNRQGGAMMSTVDRPKVDVIGEQLADINPFANVKRFGKIDETDIDEFLDGVDIVVDGVDFFSFDARRLVFKKAYEKGIPVVTAAPLGFGSAVHVFDKHSMKFDDYFNVTEDMSYIKKIVSFAIGITPTLLQRSYVNSEKLNLEDKKGPSSVLGTLAAANFAATEVFKIVTGYPYEASPVSYQYDPFVLKIKRVNLWRGNKNPIQRIKIWYFMRLLAKQYKKHEKKVASDKETK